MNLQDFSSYITNLLRSEAEIIAAFIMGVFVASILVYAARRWLFPDSELKRKLATKDAEIARKDAEISRMDAQVTRTEAKLASLEAKLLEKVESFKSVVEGTASTPAAVREPLLPADYTA